MGKFADKAKASTLLSDLMQGRTKLGTEEVIAKFPNGFTIEDFDIVNDSKSEYPVFTIKEDKTVCFFGGAILHNMVNSWTEGYENLEDCRNDFREEGGVRIRLYMGKTKTGNNLTKVDIL